MKCTLCNLEISGTTKSCPLHSAINPKCVMYQDPNVIEVNGIKYAGSQDPEAIKLVEDLRLGHREAEREQQTKPSSLWQRIKSWFTAK